MSRDALVVGINCYQYSGLPNLNSPALDAEAIAFHLKGMRLEGLTIPEPTSFSADVTIVA